MTVNTVLQYLWSDIVIIPARVKELIVIKKVTLLKTLMQCYKIAV